MEGGNSVDFGEFLSFKQLWIFKPELWSQQVFSSKTVFPDQSSHAPDPGSLMRNHS